MDETQTQDQEKEPIGLVEPPEAPPGGEEEKGGQFFNFKRGQTLEGMLVGTMPIPNQRKEIISRFILVDGVGATWILPDHVDLVRKLQAITGKLGWGARVWICYRGKRDVPGVAQPMATYRIINYGTLPIGQELARNYQAAKAGSAETEEDVPF